MRTFIRPTAEPTLHSSEPERCTVRANGIVVDVIANEDGSVYVECYAYERDKQAVVQHASIDRYRERHPNIRLDLADRPQAEPAVHRFRPCGTCGRAPDEHNSNRPDYVGHEYV